MRRVVQAINVRCICEVNLISFSLSGYLVAFKKILLVLQLKLFIICLHFNNFILLIVPC